MLEKLKKNYHWLIALLVFLEMTVYGGLINSASIFVQPVSQSLGVSTTTYSVAMMPYTISCFAGTCLSGYLFSRFGYKKCTMVSLAVVGISLVLTALCSNIYVFCFSKILFGAGYGACFTAGAVRMVKCWFHKHQGLVLGIVTMASGIGGSLMTVILNWQINVGSWRSANLVAAAMIAAVFLLYFLVKDRPEDLQLRPFGYGDPVKNTQKAPRDGQDWPGYPVKEQLKRPMFYLMCLCVVASCVCIYTSNNFMIPHFRAQGFSADQAATFQSVYMLSLAVVKLLAGFFCDRFGVKPVMIVCMLCAVIGQAILMLSTTPALCFAGVIIFSIGLCMSSIMIPLIAAPLFGYQACLSVNGIFLGFSSLSSLFANPISSLCYDACGSYVPVYRVTCLVNTGVLVLYLLLFSMVKKEKGRFYRLHPEQQ